MKCQTLEVWKLSARLSADIYLYFKDCKDYGFKDQITRAGPSVPSNIAEGMEKQSDKDKSRFLEYAKGSAAELITQTYIGISINYIDKEHGNNWIDRADHVMRMINNLQKTFNKR